MRMTISHGRVSASKTIMEFTLLSKLKELKYWHIDRKTRKIIPWIARKLPTKVKYYVVIHGMVTCEPNLSPEYVSGMEMLELWKEKVND